MKTLPKLGKKLSNKPKRLGGFRKRIGRASACSWSVWSPNTSTPWPGSLNRLLLPPNRFHLPRLVRGRGRQGVAPTRLGGGAASNRSRPCRRRVPV